MAFECKWMQVFTAAACALRIMTFFKVSQTHRLKLIWIGQILHEAQIGASKEVQTPCMDIKLSLV